jgi:hypothetical protein
LWHRPEIHDNKEYFDKQIPDQVRDEGILVYFRDFSAAKTLDPLFPYRSSTKGLRVKSTKALKGRYTIAQAKGLGIING